MKHPVKLRRPAHSTVVAYLALFLAIGGGAAFATGKIGSKQLKKNAVTAAKIKKNAVTAAKIKKNAVTAAKVKSGAVTSAKIANGAVNGDKVQDGSLTGADVNAPTLPYSRVVAQARGNASLSVATALSIYPIQNPSYVQAANEDNAYIAAVDVRFEATCTGSRSATAYLLLDAPNPTAPTVNDLVGYGVVANNTPGAFDTRIEVGPYPGAPSTRFAPGVAKGHTMTIAVQGNCTAGSGITATGAAVDVIGTPTS